MILAIFILLVIILFNILPYYSNEISNWLCRKVFRLSDEELNLRSQVKDMKYEQSSISMVDEFAKYMKLQRRIDKAMREIKALGEPRQEKTIYIKMSVRIGIYVVHAITMLCIVVTLRSVPLLMLPSELFWPLNSLIAMPSGIPGAVGVGFWVSLSSILVNRLQRTVVPYLRAPVKME